MPLVIEPSWVGRRVSVRRAVPAADGDGGHGTRYSDVVGDLLALSARTALIESRHGRVEVGLAEVAVARLAPPSTADELALEAVAAAGWQPAETGSVGGWLLRAAAGFTARANSVLPLRAPGLPLDEALEAAGTWYAERGLPLLIQVPAEARRLILRHEWEHLAAGDSRLLAAAVVAVALMPWNAALWWLYRRLRWAVETDCDARVLASGADVRAYGELLLAAAARWTASLHLSPTLGAHTSLLERRLLAMTAAPRSHRPLRALPLLAALALVGAAACDTASPTETAAAPHASVRNAIPATTWTLQSGQVELDGKNGAVFTLVPASDTSIRLVTTKDGTSKLSGVIRLVAQNMVLNGQDLAVSGQGTMVFGGHGDSATLVLGTAPAAHPVKP